MLNEFSKNILANQIWQPEKYQWDLSPREDTILYVNFDGTYEDQSIYKCVPNSYDITYKSGNQTYDFLNYDNKKFGNASIGPVSYSGLRSSRTYNIDNSNWKFGDTDFTIDFWTKRKEEKWYIDYQYRIFCIPYIDEYASSGTGIGIYTSKENSLSYVGSTKYNLDSSINWYLTEDLPNNDEWQHICLVYVKKENILKFYFNGKWNNKKIPLPDNYFSKYLKSNTIIIGGGYYGYSFYNYNNYLDEFRICKKIIWEKDFIPPTKQYTLV